MESGRAIFTKIEYKQVVIYIFCMKNKVKKIITTVLAYLYVILGYFYIVWNFSYHVRITNKPEGWIYLLAQTLFYIIIFAIVNHLLIKRILSNKLLIIIEALLLVSIFTLIISDFMYEEYLHLKYLQRTMPVITTPCMR